MSNRRTPALAEVLVYLIRWAGASIIVLTLVTACREGPPGGGAELPDPVFERLGAEKARIVQFEGVRDFIEGWKERCKEKPLTEPYARCLCIEPLVDNRELFLEHPPFILAAVFIDFAQGPAVDMIAINPQRQTDQADFWFVSEGTTYHLQWLRPIESKDEEFMVGVHFPVRFVSKQKLLELADADADASDQVLRVTLDPGAPSMSGVLPLVETQELARQRGLSSRIC